VFGKVAETLQAKAERMRQRPVLEAAMAASALVACAEGRVTLARRYALGSVDSLKRFDPYFGVDRFNAFADDILGSVHHGRDRALAAVRAIAGDGQAAAVVMSVATAIARVGENDGPARQRLGEIAGILGLGEKAIGTGPVCVVVGNPKGGSGKSTVAVHVAIGLMRLGRRVGTIDLDGRQGSLSRYLENRRAYARAMGLALPVPAHRRLASSEEVRRDDGEERERERFAEAMNGLHALDAIVIDTPAGESHLSRLGHAAADILVTPMNDSFLDVDVLAHIDCDRREVLAASPYCRMIWEQNERRAATGQPTIDWLVLRNRLAQLDARSSREIEGLLDVLSHRLGFRPARGLCERVVYRELFYRGLTVLDLPAGASGTALPASRLNAVAEVHDLLRALGAMEQEAAVA